MLRTTLQKKHLLFYWGMALFLAVILTVFANRGLLGYPFEGWTSAHFSTMARTFFRWGY